MSIPLHRNGQLHSDANEILAEIASELPDQPGAWSDITITSDEEYREAAHILIRLAELKRKIHFHLDPFVEAANSAHKEACQRRASYLDDVNLGIDTLKGHLAEYDDSASGGVESTMEDDFLPPPPPRPPGIFKRETWKATVESPHILIEFALANWETWGHLISINQGELNRLAREHHHSIGVVIPGVSAAKSVTISTRLK